jgi:hypothetical protein
MLDACPAVRAALVGIVAKPREISSAPIHAVEQDVAARVSLPL